MFTPTQAHLALLRQATVVWTPAESGAPAILVSPFELSGSAEEIQADIARRAGIATDDTPSAADLARAQQIFFELPEALAHSLSHGTLTPGQYEYRNPLVELPDLAPALPDELRHLAVERTVVVDFTTEHHALLREARWRGLWMDPKRPYGDMTYLELDMAEILGQPTDRGDDGRLPSGQERRLWKLHTETLSALQVYLRQAVIDDAA